MQLFFKRRENFLYIYFFILKAQNLGISEQMLAESFFQTHTFLIYFLWWFPVEP